MHWLVRSRGLGAIGFLVAALSQLLTLSGAAADAAKCASYELVYEFAFSGSDTTGCIGLSQAHYEAGSGTAHYVDSYCNGRAATVDFARDDDRIELGDFPYKGCNNPADLRASVALVGVSGSCFGRLTFAWIGSRIERYEALPTAESRKTCVKAN